MAPTANLLQILHEFVTMNRNNECLVVINAKESHRHISSGYPIIHTQQPSESCSIEIIRQVTILRSPEHVGQKITIQFSE